MRKSSKADLKENSELYKGCIFLTPREWMDNAIIGKCINTGGIIYDYDTLIEAYMTMDGLSYHQAAQVVDFNTERAIPYMPEPKPVIEKQELGTDEDFDDEDLD